MKALRIRVILGLLAGSLGCTKVTPQFQTLDENAIPQPLFTTTSGTTTQKEILATSATQTFTIQGQCDQRITDLTAIAVGTLSSFANLQSMTASGVTANCASTGQFAFTLKSITDLGFNVQDGTTYTVEIRGVTNGGISNPSVIRLVYSTSGGTGPKRMLLTSGATATSTNPAQPRVASSTNFRAEIRVDHMLNQYSDPSVAGAMAVKTSTNFKMKTGAAAEND